MKDLFRAPTYKKQVPCSQVCAVLVVNVLQRPRACRTRLLTYSYFSRVMM